MECGVCVSVTDEGDEVRPSLEPLPTEERWGRCPTTGCLFTRRL